MHFSVYINRFSKIQSSAYITILSIQHTSILYPLRTLQSPILQYTPIPYSFITLQSPILQYTSIFYPFITLQSPIHSSHFNPLSIHHTSIPYPFITLQSPIHSSHINPLSFSIMHSSVCQILSSISVRKPTGNFIHEKRDCWCILSVYFI